jgi:glycosyltransferase involved in cell wall biosynthesis
LSARVALTTIIAKNYLAYAKVLFESFRATNKEVDLYLLVVDEERFDAAAAGLEGVRSISPFEVLGRAEFLPMAYMYDVTELSTALKPFLLRALLGRGYDRALYFDPDMLFFSGIDPILAALENANIVLTPHLLDPIPRDGLQPDEPFILLAGAYNLGFIGLAKSAETGRFLNWWCERVERSCVIDVERGLFVDQKWIDLVPGIFEGVTILRSRALNVAYWNLHSRPLANDNFTKLAGGEQIVFFHYSGFDPERPAELSRHQNRVEVKPKPSLGRLLAHCADRLHAAGHRELRKQKYSYARFDNGAQVDRYTRIALRDALEAGRTFGDPSSTGGRTSFFAYLNAPEPGEADRVPPVVTPYMRALWENYPGLRAAFPDLSSEAYRFEFFRWVRANFWEDANERYVRAAHLPRTTAAGTGDGFGVNVAGYLRTESGVGEAGRGYAKAVKALGFPVRLIDFSTGAVSRSADATFRDFDLQNDLPVNLVCVNADQVPVFAATLGERFFAGKYNIASWWWELPRFPEVWRDRFARFDEVWAGTNFIADALSQVAPVPVIRIPPVVQMPVASAKGKADFGLSDAEFAFLFTFDFLSVAKRKNPLGLVRAFRRAFDPEERVRLVLKLINADRDPANFSTLQAACEGARVTLIDEYLSAADKNALVKCADAYVSLHRSEGFGLTLAESMLMGKPVIATGWSGNADFMNSANSFPVNYTLAPVGAGAEPYAPDQQWAEPDLDHAVLLMRFVARNFGFARDRAARGAADVGRLFSVDAVSARVAERMALVRDRRVPA